VCAERGNPVEVRARPVGVFGRPTVRRAELLGGNRMTEKRMPVAERQREAAGAGPALQLVVAGEPAGYRALCPDAKAG
jgi:hypothetical protein